MTPDPQTPSVSLDVGAELREAIARIIDPSSFTYRAKARDGFHITADLHERCDEGIAFALSKADTILALPGLSAAEEVTKQRDRHKQTEFGAGRLAEQLNAAEARAENLAERAGKLEGDVYEAGSRAVHEAKRADLLSAQLATARAGLERIASETHLLAETPSKIAQAVLATLDPAGGQALSALIPECEHAGLDPSKVAALARRLSAAAKDAKAMGLTIFGGSGSGSLRWTDPYEVDVRRGALVVAHLDCFNFDGGDGAEHEDEHGFRRGENG